MVKQNVGNRLRSLKPDKVFLWLAIPLVVLFAVVIPPLQGWDETTHFLRAYQVSTGDMMSEKYGHRAGGLIPDNIVDMNDTAVNDVIQSAQTDLAKKVDVHSYVPFLRQNHPDTASIVKHFSGSAVYSPVSYAPQAAGIYMARTVRLPLLLYDTVGRLFGAAAFVLLVYWALRLAPRGKWAILAIAMLPTSLAAAATLSPDALVNGGALLLVAFVLKGIFGEKRLGNRDLMAIAGTIILLSLAKQAYFLFAFLPLFVPMKRGYGSMRCYLTWNTIFVVAAFVVTFVWYAQVSDIAKYSYLDSRPGLHINSSEQTAYIVHHPLTYAGTFLWQVFGHFNPQYTALVGLLTWKGIVMPYAVNLLIYLGVILAFLMTRYEISPSTLLAKLQKRVTRYGPLAIGAALFVLIYTALYISFSTVGEHEIEGVQGRYFIPLIGLLIPLVALMAKPKHPLITFDKTRIPYALCLILLIQNLIALFVIFVTCYVPHMQFV